MTHGRTHLFPSAFAVAAAVALCLTMSRYFALRPSRRATPIEFCLMHGAVRRDDGRGLGAASCVEYLRGQPRIVWVLREHMVREPGQDRPPCLTTRHLGARCVDRVSPRLAIRWPIAVLQSDNENIHARGSTAGQRFPPKGTDAKPSMGVRLLSVLTLLGRKCPCFSIRQEPLPVCLATKRAPLYSAS